MKGNEPPSLLTCLLILLLPQRDAETISGDLLEEFVEVKVPQLGAFRARLWYLRQVLSFVPGKVSAVLLEGALLGLLCRFTALCGLWLGSMELVLRHPGYGSRLPIAATIVGQALLTLGALRFRRSRSLRAVTLCGCLSLFWLAGMALRATLGGKYLEGYVLLIAVALMVQAALTLMTLPKFRKAG